MSTIEDVINRLRAEYLEMPGLRLKPEQVERLCGIERAMCRAVLASLLDAKFLSVSEDGRYALVTHGLVAHPYAVKADLTRDRRVAKAS